MNSFRPVSAGLLILAGTATASFGVINPFTETFSGPGANWAVAASGPGSAPLTYLPSGGPDGSGYGSGSFGFSSFSVGTTPILFRSQDSFNSSGDAFVGNWLSSGVTNFSFSVRHNAPFALDFFARFVAGAAFTGVIYQEPVQVPANTWVTINVPISSSTPFIYEGPPSLFGSTFSNVDRVQLGIIANANIAGQAGPYVFDVDNVSITPAPGAGALLLGAAGIVGTRRRRR